MEKDIIKQIEERLPEMTTAQLKIANALLTDPSVLLFSSIEQAAEHMDVSTATVVRFANLFNFHGYTELQATMRDYYQQRVEPVGRLNTSFDELDPRGNSFRQIYMQQLKTLEDFYTPELEKKLEETMRLLFSAEHIYTAGPRGSFSIAYYLGHHLNRIFRNCDILADSERLSDLLLRIQPGDVMLVVNQPRYSKRLFRAAQFAKENGAKLIAISDTILSPYFRIADVFFAVPNKSGDFHNSLLPTMMIAELIITSMVTREPQKTRDRLDQMEPLFERLDSFL